MYKYLISLYNIHYFHFYNVTYPDIFAVDYKTYTVPKSFLIKFCIMLKVQKIFYYGYNLTVKYTHKYIYIYI
jgi:hypothetical protein